MKLANHIPKLYTWIAVIGVGTTAYLAAKETPRAMQLIEMANAKTRREKVNVAWKCYLPAFASGVITITAIIADHSRLVKQNSRLALAYGVGQTALRLYSERATPQERKEIAMVSAAANVPEGEEFLLQPENAPRDMVVQWRDYISDQEFHASFDQVDYAVKKFNTEILQVEGKGSVNEFYELLSFTELEPIGDTGDRLGWKYTPEYPGIIPLPYYGGTKDGLPCVMLDFVNPPQYGYDK